MNDTELLIFLLGGILLFAAVIWFGLRSGQRFQERMSEISIDDVRLKHPTLGGANFLFAYENDFSLKEVGYIAKDSKTNEVYKTVYLGGLKGAVAKIIIGEKEYECVAVSDFFRRRRALKEKMSDKVICESIRGFKNTSYKISGGDSYIKKMKFPPTKYSIINERNDQVSMEKFPLDSSLTSEYGRVVVYYDDLPMQVRLFMMMP